jgi:hypothetical protein
MLNEAVVAQYRFVQNIARVSVELRQGANIRLAQLTAVCALSVW